MGKGGKDTYRVKNWSKYNKSLCNRGRLTLFITAGVIFEWGKIDSKKKVVGEKMYPDSIIECCQLIKNHQTESPLHLRLRQAQGFIGSIFSLMPRLEEISVPDYSTLCRRQGGLPVEVSKRLANGENLHIGIDSTGLKVYGEGEWKGEQTWLAKTSDMDEDEHMYGFGHSGNTSR